ncbi:23S rRNA (uracil1939-C5)-methyltransferase [Thermotomaculum hydrothermale]|uniref:23S rRNA (Uracil1939-C5)-methyltransferase n=1 Tax=Thermotomaculum hydrothermale TaxID=981385 RepID=A0A7R6SXM7_9BACT|nr:RsmD family RNA methyltransferase [Thermotomaculum hydrothermale]BBB31964.1 23S rRNA (uracil1939-C5)-methyltransferase [Thermotomaculum hydrothermale]
MKNRKTLKIEKIVFGGKGLSRVEGKVVFVDGVLPGEEVEVELIDGKHFYTGKLISILTPSKYRVKNDCQYTDCGGCDFRFCTYNFEIELKKQMLIDTLNRIGKTKVDENKIELIYKERNGYRIKTGYKVKGDRVGFYRKKSHKIVEIERCLQSPEIVNQTLKKTKNRFNGHFFIECHPFKEEVSVYKKGEFGEIFKLNFGNYILFHKTGNFIQANRFLLKDFVKKVLEYAGNGESLLELYAGSGLFTIPLSFNYEKVFAYETSKDAVKTMNKSIVENNIKNIKSFKTKSEDFETKNYNAVVVDPPREGLSKIVVEKVLKIKPEKIIYISCNASTFARDYFYLSKEYTLERITLIDNFPATAHFEIVALLRRI